MKETALRGLLGDPDLPADMKEALHESTLVNVPPRTYIRHCTAQYVIMTDFDRQMRLLGDYVLGRSVFLMFLRKGAWVFALDKASKQYVIIPSSTKTAGFDLSSKSDGTNLEQRLREMKVYKLFPQKDSAASYDFLLLQ